MSAIGDKVAIVSVGLSCQTSRQIDGHVPLLRELTGDETLEKASLPFDWLISTPHGLTGLMEEKSFFPDTPEELCADNGRLRLRGHDILYWHVTRLASRPGHPGFADARDKFRYTSARFDKIANTDRVVAVISNTQGNLPWVQDEWNVQVTDTSIDQAQDVRSAFETFLGRDVEMLMVSRNPLPEDASRPRLACYHMVPQEEGWAGSGRDWAAVFKDYFSRDSLLSDKAQ